MSNPKIEEEVQTPLANGFTRRQIASVVSSRRMELTILPTEKCNFRCTYCYETFEHGAMKPHVVEGICNLISRRAKDLEMLSISWFGGEPLLAIRQVREILSHASREAERHGFVLTGGFTTNAYVLSRELMEEMVSYNQNFFQITLDGWGEQHDRTRRRADGAGTFERIWTNLLSFRESSANFEVQLRVHLSHENYDSATELCRNIRQAFGNDFRFYVDLQDIRDMGGSGAENVIPVTRAELDRMKRELLMILYPDQKKKIEAIESAPKPKGESASSRRASEQAEPEPYICYAAKPNQFLIRSTGGLGKCTVYLDDPRNDVGHLNPDGSLTLKNERLGPWFAGLDTLDPDKLGCPIYSIPQLSAEEVASSPRRISLVLAPA